MIICSSPKKEGEMPSEWFDTKKEAQEIFDLILKRRLRDGMRAKAHWTQTLEHEGKYNIIGAV